MDKKIFKKKSNAVIIFLVTAFSFSCSLSFSQTELSEKLKSHVYKLAGQNKPRNYKNRDILDSTAKYIENNLRECNYKTYRQRYMLKDSSYYYNVVCYYGDTTKKRIVIGAHYDVCDEQAGADDNASGVAGLIELARMFSEKTPGLNYCLEMVFYTLEEPPFFRTERMGSYIHAKSLHDAGTRVEFMASLEMIGYFSDEKNSQHFPVRFLRHFYPDKGNFIAIVGKSGMKKIAKNFKKKHKQKFRHARRNSDRSFIYGRNRFF